MLRQRCSRWRSASSLSGLNWLSGLLFCSATLLSSELRCARGMQVTSTGPQTVQKAEGESVTLSCMYTASPLDTGALDIEWSVVSPDTTQKDQMAEAELIDELVQRVTEPACVEEYRLISYSSGTKYVHGNHALAKGLSFAAPDPSMGDASLSIGLLSPAHSATYQCKVKKSPGVDSRKVSLVVMVKPSVPKCWVEGGEMVGEAVTLHCQSARGSTPLKYTWRRESADPIPATATQNGVTGELKISNHSQSFAGIYRCDVNNVVGAEHCRINLKVNKPPNRAAVIVGTVVGSLLLIIILLVIIGLIYWKLSNRYHYEKEFSNEIREDVAPPESRPVSRYTNRSSSQHPQVVYSQMSGTEGSFSGEACAHPCSSSTPVKSTPVEYDSKYGYAV